MRISDWSSDVCSSDLPGDDEALARAEFDRRLGAPRGQPRNGGAADLDRVGVIEFGDFGADAQRDAAVRQHRRGIGQRSEERRVGKEWVSTCRSRGSPEHEKKTRNKVEK